MSKVVAGTRAITGLNVGTASHLIEDHELVESLNGWTNQEGEWECANVPTSLYTGYTAISCLAAGQSGGSNKIAWMDGNNVYVNASSVGSLTAGSSMDAIAMNDGFMFLGATKPYVYANGHVRELGAIQLDSMENSGVQTGTAASDSINSITSAASAQLETTASISASVGEYIYITGSDIADLNDKAFEVTAVSGSGPYTYTLDVDTTDYTAAGAGGTAYGGSCGIAGEYKYYIVPGIVMSDGTALYGRPRGLKLNGNNNTYGPSDSWDADTITLSYSNYINITAQLLWNDGGTDVYDISGTRGTDYFPRLQLYRTKADGSDIYLEETWSHGDSDFTFTDSTDDYYTIDTYHGGPSDESLGAVWDRSLLDNDTPPGGTVGAVVGQRVYIADGDKVYWSSLDGVDSWNDLNFVQMVEPITLMGRVRDKLVMMSPDRIWIMDHSTELPYVTEIDAPIGAQSGSKAITVDAGMLFVRTDGLWLFDGVRVENISRRAFSSLSAPLALSSSGDTVVVSGGAAGYIARIRDRGWVWHETGTQYTHLAQNDGVLYGTGGTSVLSLFTNATGTRSGAITSKMFGGLEPSVAYRLVVDVTGATTPTVSINGARQDDTSAVTESDSFRRILWFPLGRTLNPYVTVRLVCADYTTLHGMWLEAEQ